MGPIVISTFPADGVGAHRTVVVVVAEPIQPFQPFSHSAIADMGCIYVDVRVMDGN